MTSRKILLIDDSTFSRNLLKNALGTRYHYLEASSGMSGMEMFVNERPDLVILDLTMPDLNGIEVLEKLRQVDANAKIIIGTADIQTFTQQRAQELGANGFIPKPFTTDQVQSMVQSILWGSE